MRYLILSDIHANWTALDAVLKHAHGRYERTVCLGDVVGYGAEPNQVVDWAREQVEGGRFAIIRGNHDKACCGLDSIEDFNEAAQASSVWTAGELTEANLEFLRNLPKGPVAVAIGGDAMVADEPSDAEFAESGRLFDLVHGSPADEDEYLITSHDAAHARASIRAHVTFFGHTHLQGGFFFRRQAAKSLDKVPKKWEELTISLDDQSSFLLNPGSVGQPRDGDYRAAYAVYEVADRLVTYYRVDYDAGEARRRIFEAGLPRVLGDRLLLGK